MRLLHIKNYTIYIVLTMKKIEYDNFENMNIKPDILKGVYLYGFKKPSTIQIKGITAINTGKDCIIQSQSGTGKTATYLLGVINSINDTSRALIITPTRELAKQVYEYKSSNGSTRKNVA